MLNVMNLFIAKKNIKNVNCWLKSANRKKNTLEFNFNFEKYSAIFINNYWSTKINIVLNLKYLKEIIIESCNVEKKTRTRWKSRLRRWRHFSEIFSLARKCRCFYCKLTLSTYFNLYWICLIGIVLVVMETK